MFTIRDVAKIAGVSRSTVSLVLNNSPLVRENTRQKVLDIIREIDYVPNNSARSLSSKVMYCLGNIVLVEDVGYKNYDYNYETDVFSTDVINGISKGLDNSAYSIIIERFSCQAVHGELPNMIKGKRVDGFFIVGSLYEEAFIDKLLTRGMPFVVVGGQKETKVDSVSPDPNKGTWLAAEHLIETGHKRVCLINAPGIYRSSLQRQEAIGRARREGPGDIVWSAVCCNHNSGEGGYLAIKSFMEAGNKPDGIIAANSIMAMGVLRYLYEARIRVPEDISIIVYEDSILSGYAYPAMTTINARKEDMGEIAARLLMERMKHPDKEIETIVVEPFFVPRASVQDRRKRRSGRSKGQQGRRR
jgi:LacI family transcriptional regulator/LacI family purine nucleotide synthesis repressor